MAASSTAPPHPGYHSAMLSPSVTFAGLPHATLAQPGQIAVLGIDHATPYETGKPSHSAGAPAALRAALTGYSRLAEHAIASSGERGVLREGL